MAQDLTLKVAGLYTDLNPLQEIPNGALKTADNIQIRRRGTAERRPGFPLKKNFSGISTRIEKVVPFDGDYTVFGYNALVANSRWKTSSDADIVVNGSALNGAHVPGETFAAEMQKRLYVTLEDFVARYEDAGDTTADRAGIPQPGQPWLTDLTQDRYEGWLGYGDQVGYRAVLQKTIDGQELLSAPSAASYVSPTTAWSTNDDPWGWYPTLQVNLPPRAVAGDALQFYRTLTAEAENNPTTPGDEMRLATSITLTSADISAGYISFSDTTPDTGLVGAALYTNATQQGVLLANAEPDRIGCITTYSDMMFGGNVSSDEELTLQMPGAHGTGPFDFGDNTRLWPARQISTTATCVFSQSSPTITVGGWFGTAFVAGQYVSDRDALPTLAGTYFAADTKIQSVVAGGTPGAYTITLDKNTLAFGGVPHTEFDFWPSVVVVNTSDEYFVRLGQPNIGPVSASHAVRWSAADDELYSGVFDMEPYFGLLVTAPGGSPGTTDAYFTANTTLVGRGPSTSSPTDIGWTSVSQNTIGAYGGLAGCDVHNLGSPVEVGGSGALTVTIPAASGTTFTVSGADARDVLAEGQYITDVDLFPGDVGVKFVADTKVQSLSWNPGTNTLTVTVDTATNATGGVYTDFAVWDYIDVAGVEYFGAEKQLYDTWSATKTNIYLYDESVLWSFQQLAGLLCYDDIEYNVQAYGGGSDPRSWTFQAVDSSVASVTVKSTKPLAWDKNVDQTTGVSSSDEERFNRLVWSKVQEPDAWPVGYFADIGQASGRILRVMATRESLFVFKEDGTWRVTGTSPADLRVDEYDRTLKLIHPNAVSRIDNNLMGWFVSGVMLVTDAQTQNVSDNMIGEDLAAIRDVPYAYPYPIGFDAFTVERDNQWHIVFGEDASAPVSLYVFNIVTQAWTTWTLESDVNPICGIDNESEGKILIGGSRVTGNTETVWEEADVDGLQYDGQPVGSLSPVATVGDAVGDGYAFTIAHTADPDLKAGDVFSVSQLGPTITEYFVVTVPDLTGAATQAWSTYNANIGGAGGNLYRAPVAAIEWTAKTQQNPGVRKFFREANLTFQRFDDTHVFDLKFSTDQVDDAEISGTEFDDPDGRPYAMRSLIPTNAGRSFWLNPRIDIPYVFADFRLDGCSLVYDWMSERTGR